MRSKKALGYDLLCLDVSVAARFWRRQNHLWRWIGPEIHLYRRGAFRRGTSKVSVRCGGNSLRCLQNHSHRCDQDAILDVLEGDIDEAPQPTQGLDFRKAELRVLQAQRGCNLHYKRSVLSAGWHVAPCDQAASLSGTRKWCIGQIEAANPALRAPPTPGQLLTYGWEKEAVHSACAQTIGHHQEDLAASVASALRDGDPDGVAGHMCRTVAKCGMSKKELEKRRARGNDEM
eukprot:gnl/TRDRNA2_/TRDRNA2_81140_c0_seq1.p1 gnl/TRDRNA2_/TRDRNA2_81140_c0~~gnl/TRDRNA2_/TRDRNA2_81140_c0_seq1.p1  ORF type:complete len:232 (+),score=40.53 gnl/TRDRNA2_/TRDRNA2_81140_c0_seq1:167-862(+)